jgi:hypothetical protein
MPDQHITLSNFTATGQARITVTVGSQIAAPTHKHIERLTAHPTVFVARRTEHAALLDSLVAGISRGLPFALVIRGPRGCGKSTLADDLCEHIKIKTHRLVAGAESDLSDIGPDDLVLVDALMEKTSRSQAEAWLRLIKARFLIVTTRLPVGTDVVRTILLQRAGGVQEYELLGLSRQEFAQAIAKCQSTPGCNAGDLSSSEVERLYRATAGLPMAVQLLYKLSGEPIIDANTFLSLSTLSPEEVLARLTSDWRNDIADANKELHDVLFVMSNVPILGISVDAVGNLLEWDVSRVVVAIKQLWAQGFISQLSANDVALKLHDAIREAFLANGSENDKVQFFRAKHGEYCERNTASKSKISMLDSMLRASEALFGFARQDLINAKPVQAYLIFLELRRIQENIVGEQNDAISVHHAEKLADWLGDYIRANGSNLKCNELIAIGGVAQTLPIAKQSLGDSFAPLWERGLETDSTKVTAAMLASIHHWNGADKERRKEIAIRVEKAFERQPWHSFGNTADIVAAGFAAAHAMIKEHSLGAAFLSGYRIREKGISYSAGFAVLLLSIEATFGPDRGNQFLHYNGGYCHDIDAITAAYLNVRGIQCPCRHYGSEVEENLNRQALWGVWSANRSYCQFIEKLLALSVLRSDAPPLFVLKRTDLLHVAKSFSLVGTPSLRP